MSVSIESWVIMRQGREFMFTLGKETKLYRELTLVNSVSESLKPRIIFMKNTQVPCDSY